MGKNSTQHLHRGDFLLAASILALGGCSGGASRVIVPGLQPQSATESATRSVLDVSQVFVGSGVAVTFDGVNTSYVSYFDSNNQWVDVAEFVWYNAQNVMRVSSAFAPTQWVSYPSGASVANPFSVARSGDATMAASRRASGMMMRRKRDGSAYMIQNGNDMFVMQPGTTSSLLLSGRNQDTGVTSFWNVGPNGRLGVIISGLKGHNKPITVHLSKAAAFAAAASRPATTISLSPSLSSNASIRKFAIHGPKGVKKAQSAARGLMDSTNGVSNATVIGSSGQLQIIEMQTALPAPVTSPVSFPDVVPADLGDLGGGGTPPMWAQCAESALNAVELYGWYAVESYCMNYVLGVISEIGVVDAIAIGAIIGAEIVALSLAAGAVFAVLAASVQIANAWNECEAAASP